MILERRDLIIKEDVMPVRDLDGVAGPGMVCSVVPCESRLTPSRRGRVIKFNLTVTLELTQSQAGT